ncbi:MAG TPA: hypothetical protein VLJ15_05555 [Gammaproteobacteria bacterium]|nr:hypothetical protein [Gammaproteobacteria bacterium]
MKKIAFILAIMASALVLTSCASKGTPAQTTAPDTTAAPHHHHHHHGHHDYKGETK